MAYPLLFGPIPWPARTPIELASVSYSPAMACSFLAIGSRRANHYVYNPTTHHYVRLPRILSRRDDSTTLHGLSLAFNPYISPHYKVIYIRSFEEKNSLFHIDIYSSSSDRTWRHSTQSSFPADQTWFDRGIFWNGSVHWLRLYCNSSPYFKVDKERLNEIPMPLVSDHLETNRNWSLDYFGVSGDRFHYAYNIHRLDERFYNIYKLETDYSGWSIKSCVDVSGVSKVLSSFGKTVLCVVRCEVEEDSYLVMSILGEILKYNFRNKTFLIICDNKPYPMREDIIEFVYGSSYTYQYSESLACVVF